MSRPKLPLPALLALTTVELAVFRVSIPAARAFGSSLTGKVAVAVDWLEYVGQFLHYTVSVLAAVTLIYFLAQCRSEGQLGHWMVRRVTVLTGAIFAGLYVVCVLWAPDPAMQFLLELFFTGSLLLVIGLLFTVDGSAVVERSSGGWWPKIGVIAVVLPLVFHFYGPLSIRTFHGQEALWSGLPEKIQMIGLWSIILVGGGLPFLLGARPLAKGLLRPGPIAVASLVSLIAHILIRVNFEGAVLGAMDGLGIDIGLTSPPLLRIGCMVALFAATWTFLTCVTSVDPARRQLGVGLGLVVVAGYGFRWPVQFALQLLGVFAMVAAVASLDPNYQEPKEEAPDGGSAV